MQVPLISRADLYKYGHFRQNRPGTQFISSYIEARGVEPGRDWKQVVNAGIQYYLKECMTKPIVTEASLKRAIRRTEQAGVSFNEPGWKHVLNKHGGYAPLRIQALPEGLVAPLRTPMVQVVNTDPLCPDVTSFVETDLLRSIWYPSTVATLSFHIKRIIRDYMLKTAGHTEGLDFKLHDFGARGVSSSESAQIGGMAHLMNFLGTDTNEALEMIAEYYGEDMAGGGVDAAEHSVITSFGGPDHELGAYQHILNEFGVPNKIFSIVSDSYDLYGAIDNHYGKALKEQIVALGGIGSKLVVRPDSGNPVDVVSDTILRLMDQFGYTVNQKGFKVLPSYIGVLQGDGINETSIKQILAVMTMKGLSTENIVFGMGGQLLQGVNRDTLQFAMKANEAINETFNNGQPYPVFKQPKTDSGKNSKRGRQAVIKDNQGIVSISEKVFFTANNSSQYNLLEDVYVNGDIKRIDSFENIRARVASAL